MEHKLLVVQLIRRFITFTAPNRELHDFSHHPHALFSYIHFNIILEDIVEYAGDVLARSGAACRRLSAGASLLIRPTPKWVTTVCDVITWRYGVVSCSWFTCSQSTGTAWIELGGSCYFADTPDVCRD